MKNSCSQIVDTIFLLSHYASETSSHNWQTLTYNKHQTCKLLTKTSCTMGGAPRLQQTCTVIRSDTSNTASQISVTLYANTFTSNELRVLHYVKK